MSFKHGPSCGNIDHKVRLEEQKQQLHITCPRSGKNFLARRLMVLWRRSLTSYMQKLYIHGHNFYKVEKQEQLIPSPRFHCQLCEGGGEIDNPDQRLTSDVSSMLTSYERLMEDDLFILPASTAYYAYKVYDHIMPTIMPIMPTRCKASESFRIPPICPGVLCVHVGRAHWNVWALPFILPQQVPDKPGCKENGKARRKVTS